MWTHRLHNSIGLSVQADLYFNGKWTGLSSKRRSDVDQLQAEAQAVCEGLNRAKIRDFGEISLISGENGHLLLIFGPFRSLSVFY
jgi:hypothetical protein